MGRLNSIQFAQVVSLNADSSASRCSSLSVTRSLTVMILFVTLKFLYFHLLCDAFMWPITLSQPHVPHDGHPTLIMFNINALNLDPNWILANASDYSMIMTLAYHPIYSQWLGSSTVVPTTTIIPNYLLCLQPHPDILLTHLTSTTSTATLSHVPATSIGLVSQPWLCTSTPVHSGSVHATITSIPFGPTQGHIHLYDDIIQSLSCCLWHCIHCHLWPCSAILALLCCTPPCACHCHPWHCPQPYACYYL